MTVFGAALRGRRLTASFASATLVAGALLSASAAVAQPAAAVALPAAAPAATVAPNASTGYSVTIATRYCADTPGNSYDNVRANRARNNIMETLKNLGPDTNYTNNMTPPVNPDNEDAAPQDVCKPLLGQPMTFGSNISGKAPAPVNGSNQPYMSKVGGSSFAPVTTTASVPRLNDQGQPAGGNIAGAVTIQLSQAQLDLASRSSLWLMGGVLTDALPANDKFGSGEYKFAALRCNTDALNGDNVEYIGYRGGQKHAFCYAFYIGDDTPPPTPGQIIIRKSAPGAGGVAFGFMGDVSFNPGGVFSLKNGEKFDETRAPGQWHVTENPIPVGWQLEDIQCTVDPDSGSSATPDIGSRKIDLDLKEGGKIDCTYVDDEIPPPSKITVAKATFGKTGTFPFTVTGPAVYSDSADITTTSDQGEDPVSHEFKPTAVGTYTITETLPVETGGSWVAGDVSCLDESDTPVVTTPTKGPSVTVGIATSQDVRCTFVNTFKPTASLIVRAKTIGGTNPAINYAMLVTGGDPSDCGFRSDPPLFYSQDANTSGNEGTFQTATGDSTMNQEMQTYCIAGTRPTEGADKSWVTKSVECTGDIDYDAPYNANVNFTAAIVRPQPGGTVTCDFVYVKRATVDLTKTVTAGNEHRDANVEVELNCPESAKLNPGEWPKTLKVSTSATTGTLSTQVGDPIYVDGDLDGKDSCQIVETKTGAKDGEAPPTITAKYKGDTWAQGDPRNLPVTKKAAVQADATNSKPVNITVDSGPCTLSSGEVSMDSSPGTCVIKFANEGNPGKAVATTDWESKIGGSNPQTGDGPGGIDTARDVDPAQALTFQVNDSYERPLVPVNTERSINATPLAVIALTKDITAGNDLRNGDVKIELNCTESAKVTPGDWPKTLTVPKADSNGSVNIEVSGDADGNDECVATEVSSGAKPAEPVATLTPAWNGSPWNSGTKTLEFKKTASLAGAKASNGKPVTVTIKSGDCSLSGSTLKATAGSGSCILGYSALGNPGKTQVETTWQVAGGDDSGSGTKTSAIHARPNLPKQVTFKDAYTRTTERVTTERKVVLTKARQEPICKANTSAGGVSIYCGPKSPANQIIKWSAQCRPVGRLLARGDLGYCKVTISSRGKVKVKAIGTVVVTITARAAGNANYQAWKKTWKFKVKGPKK